MSGKRILVTGPTGFIGLNLVKELINQGHQVSALVRSTSSPPKTALLKKLGANLVQADLKDPDSLGPAVAGQQAIFHLAAVARAVKIETFKEVNLVGFSNLMQAAIAAGSNPKIVFVSSLAAVGPSPFGQPHRECAIPNPISNYGKSKRAAEQLAQQFSDRLNISIVRPPIVLGPHDPRGFEMFKLIERWGVHFNPSINNEEYSVIHVTDLCAALIAVADNGQSMTPQDPAAGVYFASGDEIVSYQQLGTMIGQALGKTSTFNFPVIRPILRLIGGFNTMIGKLTGSPKFMNYDKVRDVTAGSWAIENQKLKEDTGFELSTSLAQRISQTVRWYRSQGWLQPAANASQRVPAAQNPSQGSNDPTMHAN